MIWVLELSVTVLSMLQSCKAWEVEQFEIGDSECTEVSIDFFTGTDSGCRALNSPPNRYNLRLEEDNVLGTFQFYPSFQECLDDVDPIEIQFGENDCYEADTLIAAFKVT